MSDGGGAQPHGWMPTFSDMIIVPFYSYGTFVILKCHTHSRAVYMPRCTASGMCRNSSVWCIVYRHAHMCDASGTVVTAALGPHFELQYNSSGRQQGYRRETSRAHMTLANRANLL